MKKILATILALCLIFSAVGTATITAFAEETTTEPETEVVEQIPAYTFDSSVKDWSFANADVLDNSLFNKAMYANYVNGSTGVVIATTRFENPFSTNGDNCVSLSKMADWLKTESGEMRFYVRIPWKEGTPELAYDFGVGYQVGYTVTTELEDGTTKSEEKTAYPETHATVNVPADGLWHEIRISVTELNNTIFDKYVADTTSVVKGFYPLRVRAKNADSVVANVNEFYCSNFVEYYNEAITAEINDGNIETEIFLIDAPDTGSKAGITHSTVKVTDNKFYREAREIVRGNTDTAVRSEIYVYKNNLTDYSAEAGTKSELTGFFSNEDADMRTFVKNDSDSAITFKLGIKGYAENTEYPSYNADGSVKSYANYPNLFKTVTLEPNSGWVEIRFKNSEIDPAILENSKVSKLFTQSTKAYVALAIQTVSGGDFLVDEGDKFYITPMEVYNRNIVDEVTKDFERDYKNIVNFTSYQSWRSDNLDYVTRTDSECTDLPFFNSVVTYTAAQTFTETPAKQMPFAYRDKVNADEFNEWVWNPNAEMRFWMKTANDITFTFQMMASDASVGNNKNLYSNPITVKGSTEWQEIIVKRSDFGTNNEFDTLFASGINETSNINVFLRQITSGMTKDDTFMFSRYVEFFTDKAYDKGDITRDDTVDARDLVRIKKNIANGETAFINGDIDADGKLTATDLGYVRKWIMDGAWK